MHDQVINFVRERVQLYGYDTAEVRVLDIGGRKTSTSQFYKGPQPFELFQAAEYLILDQEPGPEVDLVADATRPDLLQFDIYGFDVVICTEVLEHVENWPAILETAYMALKPGGRLILTCAGPGRRPHPAMTEDWDPPPGEHYKNVSHMDVRGYLWAQGWKDIMTRQIGDDTQAVAMK